MSQITVELEAQTPRETSAASAPRSVGLVHTSTPSHDPVCIRSRLVVVCTALAMAAFAINSLLCRLALAGGSIDAATFASVRVISGALSLGMWVGFRHQRLIGPGSSLGSALALMGYATAFALAYRKLPAGIGALVLFGAVQFTMLGYSAWNGERLGARGAAGLALASLGLGVLTLRGDAAPMPSALLLMGLAGVCWGIYSLRGRATRDPAGATAGNFLRAAPIAALLGWTLGDFNQPDTTGWLLAIASGALASAGGYILWYAALRGLRASQASIVQLSVPVLAATLGVFVLREPLTLRLIAAASAILGGIAWALPRSSG